MPILTPYQSGDRPFLDEMMRQVMLETYPEVASVGRLELKDRLEAIMARYFDIPGEIWIAREQDKPIGMLWWLSEIHPVTEVQGLLLVALGVLPEFRRQGVAKALMAIAIERKLPLRLFVNPQNQGAFHLYESLGFAPQIVEMAKSPQ